ncbi:MAG: hypothetical protein GY906_38685 [bacterium]|nr:hypothetical protein [bacterium]
MYGACAECPNSGCDCDGLGFLPIAAIATGIPIAQKVGGIVGGIFGGGPPPCIDDAAITHMHSLMSQIVGPGDVPSSSSDPTHIAYSRGEPFHGPSFQFLKRIADGSIDMSGCPEIQQEARAFWARYEQNKQAARGTTLTMAPATARPAMAGMIPGGVNPLVLAGIAGVGLMLMMGKR